MTDADTTPQAPAPLPEWVTDPVPATDDEAVRGPVADGDAVAVDDPAPLAEPAYMTPATNATTGETVDDVPPSDALEVPGAEKSTKRGGAKDTGKA